MERVMFKVIRDDGHEEGLTIGGILISVAFVVCAYLLESAGRGKR